MLHTLCETTKEPRPKECDQQIINTYLAKEKDWRRRSGATNFLIHLTHQTKSLADVTISDLQEWALTSIGKAKDSLPNKLAFEGAKRLCALAASLGHIATARAAELAKCTRPDFDMDTVCAMVQNPAISSKERDNLISMQYQSREKDLNRLAGANAFHAYLQSQNISLAAVTPDDLGRWAVKTITTGSGQHTLPSGRAFEGAQALCVIAANLSHLDAKTAKDFAAYTRPRFHEDELRSAVKDSELTREERDHKIRLAHQSTTKDLNHLAGANRFLAYLHKQNMSLANVTRDDLEEWARKPMAEGKLTLPNAQTFEGAKGLCSIAAQVEYIDTQTAQELAHCLRPHLDANTLRILLRAPHLTKQDHDDNILDYFQSMVADTHQQTGANSFMAYLKNQAKPLTEVTVTDLQEWALNSNSGKGNVPSARGFEGAKNLCALAAKMEHIDAQRAKDIAACTRPLLPLNTLRLRLRDSALTPKECDEQIRHHYFSREPLVNLQSGARGLLAHLHKQGKSLAVVSRDDLQEWATTPMSTGMRNFPSAQGFEGAQGLCALAAEVEYIDAQRAKALAACTGAQCDIEILQRILQDQTLTPKERDIHIRLNYLSTEKHLNRKVGANGIVAYLHNHGKTLDQITPKDLHEWRLTPIGKGKGRGNLSKPQVFDGALALCARAAQVGHINPQKAIELAALKLPRLTLESLRLERNNSTLTQHALEDKIRLTYISIDNNPNRHLGANAFHAFLRNQGKFLADASREDLDTWAITPLNAGRSKGNMPSAQALAGANTLCALAAEIGYMKVPITPPLARCYHLKEDLESLSTALHDTALSAKERHEQILSHYLTLEKNLQRQAGASSIASFAESQRKSLAELSNADLETWAQNDFFTNKGKRKHPGAQAIKGANELCALAARLGSIDTQTAHLPADSLEPSPSANTAEALTDTIEKRRRIEDQADSLSPRHTCALPQNDDFYRELTLSPVHSSYANQHGVSSYTGSTQTLFDELESLEHIHVYSGSDLFHHLGP